MTVEDLRRQLAELHEESTADHAWYIIADALKRSRVPHRLAMLEWVVLWLGMVWDWRASELTRIKAAVVVLQEYPQALPPLISQLVGSSDRTDRGLALEVVAAIHAEPYLRDPHAYDPLLLPLLADAWPPTCFDTILMLWTRYPAPVRDALDGLVQGRHSAWWQQRLVEEGRDRAELDRAMTGAG